MPNLSLSKYFTLLVLLGFILGTMVHEYGHLAAYRVYGVNCVIKQHDFNHVYPESNLLGFEYTVACLSGGFTVSIIYLVFLLLVNDENLRMALASTIIYEFVYALFEGFAPNNYSSIGGVLGIFIGVSIPCILMLCGRLEPTP